MIRATAILCLALAGHGIAPAQTTPPLQPAIYRSNFQPNAGASPSSGSRDGWESFPLSQEAGYDPSIQPETSNEESILARDLAPTRDGFFQLGFIRGIHMVAGEHASLRLRLRAPYITKPAAAHISIFRGEDEERHDLVLPSAAWQDLSVAPRASSATITAIAIAVDFPDAIHTRPERVLLSDVRLEALGTRRLDVLEPQALWDATRELYYFQRSYTPGADLVVHAAELTHWTITAPTGVVTSQGTATDIHHRLASDAQPGIWTLHLANDFSATTALFLVRPAQHTGLLFDQPPSISPALLTSIRARKAQLEKITVADAGSNIAVMDPHFLLPGLPSYFAVLLQPSELAMLAAIDYRATGDPHALAQSRTLLQSMARWSMWVHPWFPVHGYHSYYPVGIMTKYVVMAEQFLGKDLAPEDRARLDHSLMALSVKPIYEEYVHEDRLQFDTSNWIGNTVGGALLGALQSDDPDAAGYALGLFIKERDHVHAAYTADGSYGEGVTYHRFDLEMTAIVADAAKRLLGTSIDTALLNGDRYMRYAAYGKSGLLDYGDSHVDLTPSNVFAYLAAQNQSASMTDFYYKYRDEGTAQILPRVLWEGKIKPVAKPADEPPSTLFPQRGIAILRDNWSADSTVIGMRAGKNFNHNHADQGSVFYARNGTLWLGEAGYADYYKDPFYSTFNIQAIGHNTLLVDGNPESQVLPGNNVFGIAPTFTHSVILKDASLVVADLTSAYGQTFKQYTRSLFHITDGPLIIVDDFESRTPHTFTQIWHPQQKIVSFDSIKNTFQLTDGHNRVEVRSFGTGDLAAAQHLSPLPLTSYEQSEHGPISAPIQIEISSYQKTSSGSIMTVVLPEAKPGIATEPITWKDEPGGPVLRMGSSGIRIHDETSANSTQRVPSITAWWGTGALMVHGMRYEDSQTSESIIAEHPVDLVLARSEKGKVQIEVNAAEPTTLHLQQLKPSQKTQSKQIQGCSATLQNTICVDRGKTILQLEHQDH